MRQILRIWLAIFGVACVGIAVAHLLFGSSTIIGGGTVNATIDSDMRFYAVLFLAYGLAVLWCVRDIETKALPINLLSLIFFAGGLARALAWIATGQPNWFYVLMTPVELVVPVVNYLLVRAVCRPSAVARS
ncbi:MAG: putative rane protein [Nocardia sp.]|uniref:DUF4345 domain-containing protein n=1 Tax=Nocardia sp. TaxID=1821 RepID=UPI00263630AD|nr:DUF4345 domain-containing protein [Nocardia sp.]MCU1645922.1 putative rane protein [Nocardia sp.]